MSYWQDSEGKPQGHLRNLEAAPPITGSEAWKCRIIFMKSQGTSSKLAEDQLGICFFLFVQVVRNSRAETMVQVGLDAACAGGRP